MWNLNTGYVAQLGHRLSRSVEIVVEGQGGGGAFTSFYTNIRKIVLAVYL